MGRGEENEMLNTPQGATTTLRLNVLVEGQPDATYLAHCLELDLVAEGATPSDACQRLLDVIAVQVQTCLENDNLENLFFPAPKDVWERFGRVQDRCTQKRLSHRIPPTGRMRREVEVDQYCYA